MESIDLSTELRLRTAFRFPLQHRLARRELLWGAFLLVALTGVGWLLNMGHRIQMVHHMQHGRPCWPAWVGYRHLLKLGTVTFLGMVEYHLPAASVGLLAEARSPNEQRRVKRFVAPFPVLSLGPMASSTAVELVLEHRLTTGLGPDEALVAATALAHEIPLYTRDPVFTGIPDLEVVAPY